MPPAPKFFLGHPCDVRTGALSSERFHIPADHLVTHAACVGMTGSGKTGLCVALLEEAALAGIPALIIDPKGDMTNLALTFPDLRDADFAPWVAAGETAADVAKAWRAGIEGEGLGAADVARLRAQARVTIFTPGSTAGTPIDVLASLAAPPDAVRNDAEALAARVTGTVSALLGLLDRPADPVKSPEHVLLATILSAAWSKGESLDLRTLIGRVQQPPFKTLGALALDSVMKRKQRDELAQALNAVLAAPGFASWRSGTALDVDALAYAGGEPRLAVLSIAHLNDRERMFFVALLLEAVVTWMRRQAGTPALRLLLYFDEIMGYLPPHPADPPSKGPLLTLLKQARAFGVGCVLVTQNPVDLDYKALANAGLWLIGKLQTEQDRDRVLGGLGGSARAVLAPLIAVLAKRRFVVHDVRASGPALVQSRFVLSYLAGPLTLEQIRRLREAGVSSSDTPTATGSAAADAVLQASGAGLGRFLDANDDQGTAEPPVLPDGIAQVFVAGDGPLSPYIYLRATLGYRDAKSSIAESRQVSVAAPFTGTTEWLNAGLLPADAKPTARPPAGARFLAADAALATEGTWRALGKSADEFLLREIPLSLARNAALKLVARPNETAEEFRARCRQAADARAGEEIAALDAKAATQRGQIESRLARKRAELERDTATRDARAGEEKLSWLRTAGDALFTLAGGRRSRTALGKIGSGVSRSATQRRMRQGADLEVADTEAEVAKLEADLRALDSELEREREDLRARAAAADQVETISIAPQRSTMTIEAMGVLWGPADLADALVNPRGGV